MNSNSVIVITEAVAKLESVTKGKAFLEILGDTCLAGVIVKGIEYNEEPVYEITSKLKRSLFINNFDHLLVEKNIICFRLDINNRMSEEEIEDILDEEFEEF